MARNDRAIATFEQSRSQGDSGMKRLYAGVLVAAMKTAGVIKGREQPGDVKKQSRPERKINLRLIHLHFARQTS
ncbi:hypothetical protein HA46_00530 [Pantoea septica]|uniref:Uncharacterized protein n=1 Tax=Pantoea septica TaxID=472695 RepID=A0ABX3UXX4_9GAMM|nr:hypothetical protein HA46_00530 [Pantoea septica]